MLIWWYVLAALDPDRQREDDAPAPARAYRGTTSLAEGSVPVSQHRALDRSYPAVTGRTRPVLVRPRSVAWWLAEQGPFFRKLPGDSRIIAV